MTSKIQEMFAHIRKDTDWHIDGDMLWGYFFTSADVEKLKRLAPQLTKMGYTVVDIRPDDQNRFYWLHAEKVETHSPETLQARNEQFHALATEFGLESYDGMDVGPVPPKH